MAIATVGIVVLLRTNAVIITRARMLGRRRGVCVFPKDQLSARIEALSRESVAHPSSTWRLAFAAVMKSADGLVPKPHSLRIPRDWKHRRWLLLCVHRRSFRRWR